MSNDNQNADVSELDTAPCSVTFGDLIEGDRFQNEFGVLWTKISATTARKHSNESRNLGCHGYGYRDSICTFGHWEWVKFISPNA